MRNLAEGHVKVVAQFHSSGHVCDTGSCIFHRHCGSEIQTNPSRVAQCPFRWIYLQRDRPADFGDRFLGVIFGTKKNLTRVGFWTNSESVFRRRRQTVPLVLIIDIILIGGLLMTWFLFEGTLPLVGINSRVWP
jgi:hypothetical protein